MKKYSITKINLCLKISVIVFDFDEIQKTFSFVYQKD